MVCDLTEHGHGLEIGGPSEMLSIWGRLPVYPQAAAVDGCNFATRTVWEGEIQENGPYRFGQGPVLGRQYVREATDLRDIPSESYDFVVSSHVIEHVANPMQALAEWRRVLRSEGALILIAPHKDATFDHRRPVTMLEHLMQDFERNTGEDDMTHMAEILELHDLERDPAAGSFEEFKSRSKDNFHNRCFHHHVFDAELVARMVDHAGLQIRAIESVRPNNILAVCIKPSAAVKVDNSEFLCGSSAYRRTSPFASDCRDFAAGA